MIDAIRRCAITAGFVMHVGFATMLLMMSGFLGIIMWAGADASGTQQANVACRFERLEPSGGETLTVFSCGGSERLTSSHRIPGWAWQNRDRGMLCDLNSANRVLSCRLAE